MAESQNIFKSEWKEIPCALEIMVIGKCTNKNIKYIEKIERTNK